MNGGLDLDNSVNVWTNPLGHSLGQSTINGMVGPKFRQEINEGRVSAKRIPDAVQKEMDKRRIGTRLNFTQNLIYFLCSLI